MPYGAEEKRRKGFRCRQELVACLATCKVAPVSWCSAVPRASCDRSVVALLLLILTMSFNSAQVRDDRYTLRFEVQAAPALPVGADPQITDKLARHRTFHPCLTDVKHGWR